MRNFAHTLPGTEKLAGDRRGGVGGAVMVPCDRDGIDKRATDERCVNADRQCLFSDPPLTQRSDGLLAAFLAPPREVEREPDRCYGSTFSAHLFVISMV